MNRWCTIFIAILYGLNLLGQEQPFEGLTVNDGLSQGYVYDMIQGEDGFMWIATKDGLNRYDGYNFKVFKNKSDDFHSIGNDESKVLFEDSRGYIWIGTKGNSGINIFDPNTERFYRIHTEEFYNEKDEQALWPIISIGEDATGNIWIGTQYGQVIQLVIPEKLFDHLRLDENLGVYSVQSLVGHNIRLPDVTSSNTGEKKSDFANSFFLSKSRSFFMGTLSRIMEWDEQNENWNILSEHKHYYEDYDGFRTATEDVEGNVWFVNESQITLVEVNQDGTKEYIIGTDQDLDLCRVASDNEGNFYMSSSGGVYSISAAEVKNRTFEKVALKSESHHGQRPIMVDNTDNVWVFHPIKGISKFSPSQRKFQTWLKGESVYRLYPNTDGSQILIGTYDFGILKDRAEKIRMNLESSHFHSLYFQDSDSKVWTVQREKGNNSDAILVREDVETGVKIQRGFSEEVLYMHPFLEDKNENLWVALNTGGLGLIDQNDLAVLPFYYPNDDQILKKETETTYLYEDINGDVYQCTNNGLIKVSMDQNGIPSDYILYLHDSQSSNSLSSNHILCAMDDPTYPDSILWLGTKGAGVNKMIKSTGECTRIGLKEGLPDDVIYGILSDEEGDIWMSSNRGICRYDADSKLFTYFSEADGLQSTEFNTGSFAKLPNGELAFGGVEGLNIFNPQEIRFNTFEPPIIISSLKVNNQIIKYGNNSGLTDNDELDKYTVNTPLEKLASIDLTYDQNLLAIEYASMDFTNPSKNKYKYILEGRDQDWNDVGNVRLAIYSNLDPGEYTFKVVGTNSEGFWSKKPAVLDITIKPPWWESKFAYFSYFLLVIGLFYWFYRFQLNRAKLQNQLNFEIKEAQRLAELDKQKTNFFSNVTHEFRTPLTLIIEPIKQLLKKPIDSRIKQSLKLVEGNSEKLLHLVNQLLDLSKLEEQQLKLNLRSINVVDVITPIYQSFLVLAQKKDLALKMDCDDNMGSTYLDKVKLEKVVHNLLSNAIKFTENGEVIISCSAKEDNNNHQLHLVVSDTGSGVPKHELPYIFDRFYQVDGSHIRKAEGTGIGLSLTRELVDLMGGTIVVDSHIGRGTTFKCIIPMHLYAKQTKIDKSVSSHQEVRQSADIISLSMAKTVSSVKLSYDQQPSTYLEINSEKDIQPIVLLVEDNTELRQFIKQTIATDYKVIEAVDGQEGIDKARIIIPDIIISDVMMPHIDGYQLTDTLKNDPLTSHVPIILLTAKSSTDSRIEGIKSGADAYIGKPFDTVELLVRIKNLVQNRLRLQEKYQQQVPIFENNKPATSEKPIHNKIDADFLQQLNELIEVDLANAELSVESLSKSIFMSRSQLYRKLKALTGESPNEYVRNYKLEKSYQLLLLKEVSHMNIAAAIGFTDEKYFVKIFKQRFRKLPKQI